MATHMPEVGKLLTPARLEDPGELVTRERRPVRQSRMLVLTRRPLKRLVNFRDMCHHQRLVSRRAQTDDLLAFGETGHGDSHL